jgi:hypothetical protein
MSVLEFLLRASADHPDAWDFIGPTVGAAALGMMLPELRIRPAQVAGEAERRVAS